jgi:hypothetical protein
MSDRSQVSYVKDEKLSYLQNPTVLRAGSKIVFSEAEVSEYIKCSADPKYFAKNYCKIISLDHGLIDFDLFPYQERLYDFLLAHLRVIMLSGRQSGKTQSIAVWLLWYALFRPDSQIAILANKGSAAREVLARITLALENLPFFLQAGCRELNKGSITWENNSKIFCAATTGSSIRGRSVNIVYLDEFGHCDNAEEFYESTYPVVTSGKNTRVIISSTPKGQGNMFHKLWEGAVQGSNEYKPFKVNWNDVPGRDEDFRKRTVSNTSERQFQQEYCCEFLGTSNTLLSAEALMLLQVSEPLRREYSDCLKVYKDPIKGHVYIANVDVGKGRGRDYSVMSIIDVSTAPFEHVAVYRSNIISPILFPNIIARLGKRYCDAYVIVESNDSGETVYKGLHDDLEYENLYAESTKNMGGGLHMGTKVKRIGCSNLKDLMEGNKLKIWDAQTIIELSYFVAKSDSFSASGNNHDDLVMPLVAFAYFMQTDTFMGMTDINLRELLFQESIQAMEDDIPHAGIFDDGQSVRSAYAPPDEFDNWLR